MPNTSRPKSQKKAGTRTQSQRDEDDRLGDVIDDVPLSQQSMTSSDAGYVQKLLILLSCKSVYMRGCWMVWQDYGCRCSTNARFVVLV
jgi:hypothetical protein